MPYTPYHFGPSGFIGLLFRKWIDLPVFLLANVAIDVEVLLGTSQFPHQSWHFHTFLIGTIAGALFGLTMVPLSRIFEAINLGGIFYKSSIAKSVISGVLGWWLHVLIDGFYHWDVQAFWPSNIKTFWLWANRWHLSQERIRIICLVFWVAAMILYAALVILKKKQMVTKGKSRLRNFLSKI